MTDKIGLEPESWVQSQVSDLTGSPHDAPTREGGSAPSLPCSGWTFDSCPGMLSGLNVTVGWGRGTWQSKGTITQISLQLNTWGQWQKVLLLLGEWVRSTFRGVTSKEAPSTPLKVCIKTTYLRSGKYLAPLLPASPWQHQLLVQRWLQASGIQLRRFRWKKAQFMLFLS